MGVLFERSVALLLAAFVPLSCATSAPRSKAPANQGRASTGFSRALPALIEAENAARDQKIDEASRLFESALPLGVRSAEIFYEAARMAARRRASSLAFAHLESMRLVGIKDVGALETAADLESLRGDPRWAQLVGRARAAAERSRDPESAKIVTADIDRFWSAYDAAKDAPKPVEV